MAELASGAPAVRDGDVVLLVGTAKGAFVLTSDAARRDWRIHGPHFRGEAVYSLALDQRGGRRRLLAGAASMHWGPTIRVSDDLGATWSDAERQSVRFPESSGLSLAQVWQITPGPADDPGRLWCGVEPSALFESRDGGESWSAVEGLLNHEHRPQWQPGGGGLCLHTIVPHPTDRQRMLIAMSTGGVYRTDDGGATWRPRNSGVRAEFLPNKHPEFGQCVHKVANNRAKPERLFLQNHWGLYRSDDFGDSWHDVANGVPSDFGFAMVTHPHDGDTAYVVPLESDMFRCTPEAKLRVFRTRDAGASWEPLAKGLPQEHAYETVVRDAMGTDTHDDAGVYFGTRSGKVFCSANAGDDWNLVADGLPSVCCVRATVVGAVA